MAGHKLDALRRCPKASFCVVDQDQVVPETYTTYFRSVIAFGAVRILVDEAEKRAAADLLAMKYAPADSNENRAEVIRQEWPRFCMLELSVEHLTGKEAIELMRERRETP